MALSRHLYPTEIQAAPSRAGIYLLYRGSELLHVWHAANIRDELTGMLGVYSNPSRRATQFAYEEIRDEKLRRQQAVLALADDRAAKQDGAGPSGLWLALFSRYPPCISAIMSARIIPGGSS